MGRVRSVFEGAPNHLLALQPAPKIAALESWQPTAESGGQRSRADAYARMLAETTYLQQLRAALRAQTEGLMDDLLRGIRLPGRRAGGEAQRTGATGPAGRREPLLRNWKR